MSSSPAQRRHVALLLRVQRLGVAGLREAQCPGQAARHPHHSAQLSAALGNGRLRVVHERG